MAFSVSQFRAELTDGGARTSLFEVQVTNPSFVGNNNKFIFMCKASEIPESRLSSIEVPYFGRKIKLAGHKSYATWNVTVINDEDFSVRKNMEVWQNSINSAIGNLPATGVGSNPLNYKSKATVKQYGKAGNILRTYNFDGLFPTLIAAIPLDWNQPDSIEEFRVDFEYDFYTALTSGGSQAAVIV